MAPSSDSRKSAPTVSLWLMTGIGLIIPYPSGVMYSNQVGGYACDLRAVEGIFVPLNRGGDIAAKIANDAAQEFHAHFFTGPKWGGHCYEGIDEETADFIDALLEEGFPGLIKVNRSRLPACKEAWIEILIEDDFSHFFDGLTSKEAILTWENSD